MTAPLALHVFPTLDIGGQQTRFATIANQLGQRFRHRLISLDGRDAAMSLLDTRIDATLVPLKTGMNQVLNRIRDMSRVVKTVNPDIVVTYNWGAIEWAIFNRVLSRRRHIHLEDGFGPDEADRQKWRRRITRQLILGRSTVVVPSRNLQTIAASQWGLDPNNVVYIPNGIDAARFDRVRMDGGAFFQRDPDTCVIGSFSPLRAEKNLGRLLRAYSGLRSPRLQLVICGEGPERQPLERLARELRIENKVTFTGHVPGPEAVLGNFDVFGMTSDTEQMPYAVLEAMAARLPVVATAVGDIPIMVAAENGPFIVPRDSMPSLVSAFERISTDGALRKRIGDANRAKVERDFGVPAMAEAFCRVLSGKPASRPG
jgi:glycosyltransferase involved in cell wall biosynthesis